MRLPRACWPGLLLVDKNAERHGMFVVVIVSCQMVRHCPWRFDLPHVCPTPVVWCLLLSAVAKGASSGETACDNLGAPAAERPTQKYCYDMGISPGRHAPVSGAPVANDHESVLSGDVVGLDRQRCPVIARDIGTLPWGHPGNASIVSSVNTN